MTPRFVFGLQHTAVIKEEIASFCHGCGGRWRLMGGRDAAEKGQRQLWDRGMSVLGGVNVLSIHQKAWAKNQRTPRLGIRTSAKRSREFNIHLGGNIL